MMGISQTKSIEAFCFFTAEMEEKTEFQKNERSALIMNILQSLTFLNHSFGNEKVFPLDISAFQTVRDIHKGKYKLVWNKANFFYSVTTTNMATSLFKSFQSLQHLTYNKKTFEESQLMQIQENVKSLSEQWNLFCEQEYLDKKKRENLLEGPFTFLSSHREQEK